MAERIVSPAVFTREKDSSFLPQGIGEIGAALVGQSIKGPTCTNESGVFSRISTSIWWVN